MSTSIKGRRVITSVVAVTGQFIRLGIKPSLNNVELARFFEGLQVFACLHREGGSRNLKHPVFFYKLNGSALSVIAFPDKRETSIK